MGVGGKVVRDRVDDRMEKRWVGDDESMRNRGKQKRHLVAPASGYPPTATRPPAQHTALPWSTYDARHSFVLLVVFAAAVVVLLVAFDDDDDDDDGSDFSPPPPGQFEITLTLPLSFLPLLHSLTLLPLLPPLPPLRVVLDGLCWLATTGVGRGAVGALSHAAEDYGGCSLASVGLY